MKSVRLLPVVVLAVSALLVLKTLGLATSGSYVLGGMTAVQAAEGDAADTTITLPSEPTMTDSSPTMADSAPVLEQDVAGTHTAAAVEGVAPNAALPPGLELTCAPSEAGALPGADCVPLIDALPTQLDANGQPALLAGPDGGTMSERALLERLAERRTELDSYEQQLSLRAALVDAAEKKVDERQATLQALETQIATLVDKRTALESGQFAGIVTLYENMRPKDAANIFNSLDMEVLLRVAKQMNPRKMSPILAAMNATRAQELTVRMAALADQPAEQMSASDVAALPQIVGQ